MSRKLVKISDDFLEPHRARASILTAWRLNPVLRSHSLEISVVERNLMLKGRLPDFHEKNLAIRIAVLLGPGLKVIDQIFTTDGHAAPDMAAFGMSTPGMVDSILDLYGAVADATADARAAKWIDGKNLESVVKAVCQGGVMTVRGHIPDSAVRRDIVKAMSGLYGVNRVEEDLQVDKVSWTDRLKNAVSRKKRDRAAIVEPAVSSKPSVSAKSISPAEPEDLNFKDKVTDGLKDAGDKASDVWITSKIKAAYVFNRRVNPMRIRVSTLEGEVTLSGRAMSKGEYEMAEKIATNVAGVVKIFNRIEKGWEREGN